MKQSWYSPRFLPLEPSTAAIRRHLHRRRPIKPRRRRLRQRRIRPRRPRPITVRRKAPKPRTRRPSRNGGQRLSGPSGPATAAGRSSMGAAANAVEPPPPEPGPQYAWTGGYWSWYGRWVWIHGRWLPPPQPGYHWIPPYYDHRGDHVVFVGGFWADRTSPSLRRL